MQLSWIKMLVVCSKTVARGWSKVSGVPRDSNKDMAVGNPEVRREDVAGMASTPSAGTQEILRDP